MAGIILEGGRKRQAAEVLPEAHPSEETFVLFDDKMRISQEPKSYGQTDWAYLDQSGRVEAQRVRKFLTDLVLEYPHCHRDELITRISEAENRDSAIFELIIYALLRSLKCLVKVHDPISDKQKCPDFHATTPDGESVYIEAVLASEYSKADLSARKPKSAIYSAIEKMCALRISL